MSRVIMPMVPNRLRKGRRWIEKPHGALDRERRSQEAPPIALSNELRDLLRHIADNADLIDYPRMRGAYRSDVDRKVPTRWLLIPAPEWVVDELAVFEAGLEDLALEEDNDTSDNEPDITRPESMVVGDLDKRTVRQWRGR